jgi:NAD dependent epimerase/dehydratase family enzyme
LNGCGILPQKLLKTGFQFTYTDLSSALNAICHGN